MGLRLGPLINFIRKFTAFRTRLPGVSSCCANLCVLHYMLAVSSKQGRKAVRAVARNCMDSLA